jgi:DNA-binding transcriptional LysR family regulator
MPRRTRYKDLQLGQLRSFLVAATEGNFTIAAKSLGASVPTVWQQVRSLERRLGTTLLWRRGRELQLSQEGRLLLELIQPHVSGLDSLERMFETRRIDLPQQLTVAATYYLLSAHLPDPSQNFTQEHPRVRLILRGSLWPEVIRLVERGEADLGVVSYSPDEPRSPYLTYEHLFDLQLTLLTATQHPLARKKQVTPEDLVKYPMILSGKETFSHKTLERILNRHNLAGQIQVVMESPNTDIMRKYVARGLGIALTYLGGEDEPATPGLSLRVFDPELEPLPVFIVVRKDAYLPEPVEQFRRVMRKMLGGKG